ncbi:MAG: response regulator [Bdellovibrionales bacterium]
MMKMPTEKRRLLIVDDEPELLSILKDICKPLTAHIDVASDGYEALAIFESRKVDAVLSDIMMPRMTGIQLFINIRQRGLEVPFIFLTGFSDQASIAKALQLGASDFLEKPFQEKKLLNYVNLALDLGAALNALETEVAFFSNQATVPAESLREVHKARKELWKLKFSEEFDKIRMKTS